MAQLKLYKGTQTEYDTKKNKITDGGLIMVKENNDSSTGSLYIKDGSNNIRVSTDEAVTGFTYTNGQVIASQANGDTATVLQVDSSLSMLSSNPIQNATATSQLSSLSAGLEGVKTRATNLENRASGIETDVSGLKAWQTVAAPTISDNGVNISKMWNGATDFGKSIRTIANEELAAALLTSVGNDNFTDLQALATWLDEHPDDAVTMNAAIQNLDLTKAETRTISQSDYYNLSETEKNNGTIYLIYDAHGFVGMEAQFTALQERVTVLENNKYDTASKVGYIDTATGFNTDNVQGAINALNTKVNSNYNNLNSRIDTALGNIETLLSQI